MFVRYYVDLAVPFDAVEERLLDAPERWLPGLLEDAEDRGARLLADVGFPVTRTAVDGQRIEVSIGDVYRGPGKSSIPVTWTAEGGERLFPSLDGDVEVAALGERRTQLSISARYRAPTGAAARALDRALMHRVVEATVKDFLDRVARALDAPTDRSAV